MTYIPLYSTRSTPVSHSNDNPVPDTSSDRQATSIRSNQASNLVRDRSAIPKPRCSRDGYDFPLSNRDEKQYIAIRRDNFSYSTPMVRDIVAEVQKTPSIDYLDLASRIRASTFTRAASIDNNRYDVIDVYNDLKGGAETGQINYEGIDVLEKTPNILVLRQWPADQRNVEFPRTTIFVEEKATGDVALYFSKIFGNIDLVLIPNSQQAEMEIQEAGQEGVKFLDDLVLTKIMSYLSDGQRINIDYLASVLGVELPGEPLIPDGERWLSNLDLINHRSLRDFGIKFREAKNGHSIIPGRQRDEISILHQTTRTGLDAMSRSGEINVSKAGCLGRAIYGTVALVGEDDQKLAGGHAQAMYLRSIFHEFVNRYRQEGVEDPNLLAGLSMSNLDEGARSPADSTNAAFILFTVKLTETNNITNWIERFGGGQNYLDAAFRMRDELEVRRDTRDDRFMQQLNGIMDKAILEYDGLYRFLLHASNMSAELGSNPYRKISEQDFDALWGRLLQTREKHPTLINNVLFECFKDYALLHTQQSFRYGGLKTFDMDRQYSMIFDMFPDMLTDWNTVKFEPSLDQMAASIKKYDTDFDLISFKKEMAGSILFYFGNRVLSGASPVNPSLVKKFENLAASHPNLAGILYHFFAAWEYKNTPFFDRHLEFSCASEEKFRENAGLSVAYKAGFFGTEEAALYANAKAKSQSVDFFNAGHKIYMSPGNDLGINIQVRATNKSGFTQRTTKP